MKPRIGTLALAVLLLLTLALGARLAWVAAHLETGPETLALSWRGATLGQVGYPRIPLRERPPTDQADFWLAEVDRIFAEREPTAEMLMGAAWILAEPYWDDPVRCLASARLAEGEFFPLVDDSSEASQRFEAKCSARCLQLAAAATELEPDNVGLWRQRALLSCNRAWPHDGARCPDWLDQLALCSRHDPGNALYDYLAAYEFWITSSRQEYVDYIYDEVLVVDNPLRFAQGVDRFEQGLKKPFVAMGGSAVPGAAEFVRHTRLPRAEQTGLVMDLLVDSRAPELLRHLRWHLSDWARMHEFGEDSTVAAALYRQGRQMTRQITADDSAQSYRAAGGAELMFVESLLALPRTAFDSTLDEDLDDLRQQRQRLRVQSEVAFRARQELGVPVFGGSFLVDRWPGIESVVPALLMSRTLAPAVVLFGLGVIGLILSRWFPGNSNTAGRLGPLRLVAAWTVACGATFGLLGFWRSPGAGEAWSGLALACLVWLAGLLVMAPLFRRMVRLWGDWARRPEDAPVVSIVATLTLWQIVIAVLAMVQYELGVGQESMEVPFDWLFKGPNLPRIVLAVAVVVGVGIWIWRVLRYRRHQGHLPWARWLTWGLLLPSALVVVATFWACMSSRIPEFWAVDSPLMYYLGSTFDASREPKWHWAVLMWIAYGGVFLSTVGSLLIAAAWYAMRHKKQARSIADNGGRPAYWGGLLACLSRSSLVVAGIWLLVHLAVAPGVLRSIEEEYHQQAADLDDPLARWSEVDAAIEAIENDPRQMAQIRAAVAEQIRAEDEAESGWDDFYPVMDESEW